MRGRAWTVEGLDRPVDCHPLFERPPRRATFVGDLFPSDSVPCFFPSHAVLSLQASPRSMAGRLWLVAVLGACLVVRESAASSLAPSSLRLRGGYYDDGGGYG